MSGTAAAYDRIAHLYDLDMGRSMPFDDVGWYAERVSRRPGRVLEIGCGTGRVLLPLLAAGREAMGIDAAPRMLDELRRKARGLGLSPRALAMETPPLGFATGAFTTVLAPYSVSTYLDSPEALGAFFREARRATVTARGQLIVDAFVPREVGDYRDYRVDYRRRVGGVTLERSKRIRVLPDGRHRIDRRYEVHRGAEGGGAAAEPIETSVIIRPYRAEDLIAAAEGAGWRWIETALDYGRETDARKARFATVVFVRRAASR